MAGMEAATQCLALAIKENRLICMWGDYDVDGTTGAAALVSFVKEIGGRVSYYVPHRIDEGYGLNRAALARLKREGVGLVVTVDCGIGNRDEIQWAREQDMTVIVVDHHAPPQELPPAAAVLNPHRADCPFPDKGLSGAGLAFYLLIGLRARLREAGWFGGSDGPDVRRYLDIVTLGTIADMVPLRGINRVLVRRGLRELAASQRPGVVALKEAAGVGAGPVSVGQVAFRLGPRINAAGRMDAGVKVVEMLTTDSADAAAAIARELNELNGERQALEARTVEDALSVIGGAEGDKYDPYTIVVGRDGWHPGVVGIVASRVVEKFYRPTVVVAFREGEGRGSARSIRGFHIADSLSRCADLLEKFGGHEYAGGLTIREERFPLFQERFEALARERLSREDLVPDLEIDAALTFSEIDADLLRQIERLEPFGVGNPEPLFMTPGIEVVERRDFPSGARFRLRQGGRSLSAVAFGASAGPALAPHRAVDLAYRLSENVWQGLSSVELRVVDARPS